MSRFSLLCLRACVRGLSRARHRSPLFTSTTPTPTTPTPFLAPQSRGLWNLDEIMPVLEATGMPVRVIYDMGALSWAEQVQAMAESGILVAVHGAALTNVIFMPANAVLIEVFPWNYRSFLYRDLAWKAGLQYYPLASLYPDFEKIDPALLAKRGDGVYGVYESEEYKKKCSDPHMSSMDVYSIAECTHRAKYTFPMVNIEQLRVTVNDALDDIGCRDGFCHEVQFRRNDEPVIHHITDMKTKVKSQCAWLRRRRVVLCGNFYERNVIAAERRPSPAYFPSLFRPPPPPPPTHIP